MTRQKLIEILQLGKGQTIEFKAHSRPDIVGVNVCAFLNGRGGYVVCGVGERSKIIGIEGEDLALSLEVELAKGLVPKALVSVQIHEVDGRNVLVVEVPAGQDVPYAFRDQVYVREGARTVNADIETIKDMVLRRQAEPERWERRFSTADIGVDLDVPEIANVVQAAVRSARMQFRYTGNPQAVLEDLAVAKYGRLTNAGDVLFTSNPELRHPQVRVRAVCFNTDRTDDRYRDEKSFSGPLVRVLEECYRFIVRNTPTLAQFKSSELARENEPFYPPMAIREGLVNAFAHRDYADYKGGVAIHVYPRRVEIWNSGSFPEGVTAEKLAKGHISVLRNPDIAHVLYLRGMMEKVGRGSLLVMDSCEKRGLPAPEWSSDELGVTLTFRSPEVTPNIAVDIGAQDAQESTKLAPSRHQAKAHVEAHVEAHEAHVEAHGPMSETEAIVLRNCATGPASTPELLDALGYKTRTGNFKKALTHLLDMGLVEMTIPKSRRSPNQKYRLTAQGKALLENL